jgi:hypothetical protein
MAAVVNTWPHVVTLALSVVMSSKEMLHRRFCFTASAMIIAGTWGGKSATTVPLRTLISVKDADAGGRAKPPSRMSIPRREMT